MLKPNFSGVVKRVTRRCLALIPGQARRLSDDETSPADGEADPTPGGGSLADTWPAPGAPPAKERHHVVIDCSKPPGA